MMETAQANAAKVLIPMLTEMGFKEENVTIAFRKHYGANDIMKLLPESHSARQRRYHLTVLSD